MARYRVTVDTGGTFSDFVYLNEATGERDTINVVTTQLRTGELFYMIAVSPSNEYNAYQNTFSQILRSLRLND